MAKIVNMGRKLPSAGFLRQRPLLSLPQVILLLAVIGSIVFALDYIRREQLGSQVNAGGETVRVQVQMEATRQVYLQATLEYVQSEDYVAAYARGEGGMLLPGESRVAPILVDATPVPTAFPEPTPDPAYQAQPWQAWWRLLTDQPMPTR